MTLNEKIGPCSCTFRIRIRVTTTDVHVSSLETCEMRPEKGKILEEKSVVACLLFSLKLMTILQSRVNENHVHNIVLTVEIMQICFCQQSQEELVNLGKVYIIE